MLKSSDSLFRSRFINETDELHELERAMAHFNWTSEILLEKLMQPCDRMLMKCLWLNENIPCERLFKVSKTTQGFCCSFNYKGTPKYTFCFIRAYPIRRRTKIEAYEAFA